jgi:hypothetical protein
VIEFAVAWPALPLTLAAILIERLIGNAASGLRTSISLSALIAAAYLGAGALGVWFVGPLPHNPTYDYLGTPPGHIWVRLRSLRFPPIWANPHNDRPCTDP